MTDEELRTPAAIIVGTSRHFADIDGLHAALTEPFAALDIEWRVQTSGKTANGPWVRVLAYIDNRAIMERLDETCGADGWRNEFKHAASGAVLCGLSIKVNGEWITKWDGANETDIEAAKGGLSNAMKRAAVQWGIGRYLYNLSEDFATVLKAGDRNGEYLKANPQKHGDALYWRAPVLPTWALPKGSGKPGTTTPAQHERAAVAETTLKRTHNDVYLPGTSAHFNGMGGKRIGDVPTGQLIIIRDFLNTKDGYTKIVDAINLALDDRTQTGA